MVSRCGGWCRSPETLGTNPCGGNVCPPKEWVCDSNSCEGIERRIRDLLERGNYCGKDEDCMAESYGCPFGCENLLNRNYEGIKEVEKLSEKYRKKCPACFYGCAISPKGAEIVCRQSKCVDIRY